MENIFIVLLYYLTPFYLQSTCTIAHDTRGMSVGESDVKIGCLETGSAVSVRQRSPDLTLRCRQRKRNGGYVQTTKTRTSFTDKHCTFN